MGAGWRALRIRRAPFFDVRLQVSERTDRMAMEGEGHVDSLDHRDRLVAGVLAKLITPGDRHEPQGFILTTLLGIAGAFVMTYLGQAVGWKGRLQGLLVRPWALSLSYWYGASSHQRGKRLELIFCRVLRPCGSRRPEKEKSPACNRAFPYLPPSKRLARKITHECKWPAWPN
jgi:hypothetical protein